MTDKPDNHSKPASDASADDEPIIDLLEEVPQKTDDVSDDLDFETFEPLDLLDDETDDLPPIDDDVFDFDEEADDEGDLFMEDADDDDALTDDDFELPELETDDELDSILSDIVADSDGGEELDADSDDSLLGAGESDALALFDEEDDELIELEEIEASEPPSGEEPVSPPEATLDLDILEDTSEDTENDLVLLEPEEAAPDENADQLQAIEELEEEGNGSREDIPSFLEDAGQDPFTGPDTDDYEDALPEESARLDAFDLTEAEDEEPGGVEEIEADELEAVDETDGIVSDFDSADQPMQEKFTDSSDEENLFVFDEETNSDGVIEITEFEEDFLDDDDSPLDLSGDMGEDAEAGDDFLQLIDVEDDIPEEWNARDDLIELDESSGMIESKPIDAVAGEEEAELGADSSEESMDADFLGIEAGTLDDAETLGSEDFDLQSESYDEMEETDTPPVYEPQTEALAGTDEPMEEKEPEPVASAVAGPIPSAEPGPPIDLNEDALEAAVERIIQEKYSTQIKAIISRAIEKAVTREINRYRDLLLENRDDDSE